MEESDNAGEDQEDSSSSDLGATEYVNQDEYKE